MLEDVGGIPAGTTADDLNGRDVSSILNDLLFPTVEAEIQTPKSVTLSHDGSSGTLEIGTAYNFTLTANFNQGVILFGNKTTTIPLVGSATLYAFSGTGIAPTSQVGNTLGVSGNVVSGSNNWQVTVDHAAGTGEYLDNKGNVGTNLDANRAAGQVSDSASSPSITGRYRQFHGPSATDVTLSAEARALPNTSFDNTNSFTTASFTQNKYIIAIPATKTLVSAITSNNENITENFVETNINVNDAGGNPVAYKIYTFTSVSPLNVTATITLS